MRKYSLVVALVMVLALIAPCDGQSPSTSAQTTNTGVSPDRVLGEVMEINLSAREITLSTAASKKLLIKIDEKAIFRRVPASEKSLDKAVDITFGDISVGDRVIARGAADGQTGVFLARALIVMSKAEITQKRERDRAEWLRRGISGVVRAINRETKEITMLSRTTQGDQSVVITTAGGVRFRRYAPDSAKYSDVVQSSFEELKVGDQMRALGEKSADGTHYQAEEIISGTVRTSGGTIVAVNASSGEMTINDLGTRRPLTVVVNKDSVIRRFTPELVKLLEQGTSNSEAGTAATGGGDIQHMIERLPPITVAELKSGDAILVSSMAGADSARITAVLIATGVEDFLKRREKLSTQRELNLGLGLPAGAF